MGLAEGVEEADFGHRPATQVWPGGPLPSQTGRLEVRGVWLSLVVPICPGCGAVAASLSTLVGIPRGAHPGPGT